MELDKTVLLIYHWLKDHNLARTCNTLALEYGNTLLTQEKPSCNLKEILDGVSGLITCFSSSRVSFSDLVTHNESATNATAPKRKVNQATKKEKSPGDHNEEQEAGSSNGVVSTAKTADVEVVEKPTSSKAPRRAKGCWVCPEMEETLLNVYERVMLSINLALPKKTPEVVDLVVESGEKERDNQEEKIQSETNLVSVQQKEEVAVVEKEEETNNQADEILAEEDTITETVDVTQSEKKKKKKKKKELDKPLNAPEVQIASNNMEEKEKENENTTVLLGKVEESEKKKKKKKKRKSIVPLETVDSTSNDTLSTPDNTPKFPKKKKLLLSNNLTSTPNCETNKTDKDPLAIIAADDALKSFANSSKKKKKKHLVFGQ